MGRGSRPQRGQRAPPTKKRAVKAASRSVKAAAERPLWDFTKVATEFIEHSSEDASSWQALMSTPLVAHYTRKVVVAKVKRDPSFAKGVALTAILGINAVTSPPRLAAPPPTPETPTCGAPRTPSVIEESPRESPPRKVRRRLRFKQGYDAQQELIAESALGSLSLDLTACIFSFLDVCTKITSALSISMGLREVLQHRGSWDPLIIEKSVGRGLLHQLKHKDPLGYFTEERLRARKSFPRGFFEISTLTIDLMDPEKVEAIQSDTEDEAPRPPIPLIPDPLDEILKRLKHYFTRVCELRIRNIEDYRMDYRFVELRCNELCSFPYVQLSHSGLDQPPTYELHAKRHTEPQPLLDLAAAKAMNSARIPQGVDIKETRLTEREALFLQEHLSAFKNGNDFCLSHSIYRYVPSHTVRKKYKAVVDRLRFSFPEHFGAEYPSTTPK